MSAACLQDLREAGAAARRPLRIHGDYGGGSGNVSADASSSRSGSERS